MVGRDQTNRRVSLTAAQDLTGYMGRAKERPSRLLRDAYHRRHRFRSRFGCFGWLLSLATSYRRTGTVATIPATTICVSATLTLCTRATPEGAGHATAGLAQDHVRGRGCRLR
jgi:hypothetical protein